MNTTVRHRMDLKKAREEGIARGKELGREALMAEVREGVEPGPKPLETLDDLRELSPAQVNDRWPEVQACLESNQ